MTHTPRRQTHRTSSTDKTSQNIGDILPSVLRNIGKLHQERPDLIVASWPEIIGPRLAAMTEATHFEGGFLHVKIKNSTLYSLLTQHDRPRLLKSLRQRFPRSSIKNIVFRIG